MIKRFSAPDNPRKILCKPFAEILEVYFPGFSGTAGTEKQKGAYIIEDMVIWQPLNIFL